MTEGIKLLFERAEQYYTEKKYEQCIETWTSIITADEATDADKAKAYTTRGHAKSALGKHEEAIEDYNKAFTVNLHHHKAQQNKVPAEVKQKAEREPHKTERSREKTEQETIEGLIGTTNTDLLATEFLEKEEELKKERRTWTLAFIACISLFCACSASVLLTYIIFLIVIWVNTFNNLIIFIPLPFVFLITASPAWLAIFCAKRRSEMNMLVHEYAYKAVFAKAYDAYKKEIEDLQEPDETLRKKLLDAAISTLADNPGYSFQKKTSKRHASR